LLENQKLRDEVTDAQNALYPEQYTKEEAKAQIRGLSSALQRINQLLKNSKEKDRIRDEEIQRQIYALEERRRQIKNLGEQITEKNARLEAQQEFLNSALDAGKEQKRKIKNQEMAIGWKNEGIAKRNAALKTKDEEIRKKDELLEKKSAEIFRMEKKMESNMKAKDELIKKMEIGIKRKDVEVKLHIVAEMLSVMGKMGVNAKALRDLDRGQSSTDAIRKMGKTGTVNFFATGSSETSSKGGGKA
jgi:chromosome segregation ATPase